MDPDFTDFLDQFPPIQFTEPARQRAASAELRAQLPPIPLPDTVRRQDDTLHAADGHAVPIRRYQPLGVAAGAPVVLWLHGGGYCIGCADEDEVWCAQLADDLGVVVTSVDYRLAPEDPYPAGFEDCCAAFLTTAADAPTIVAGMSAGAGLAAALALRARDEAGPAMLGQVLLCPFLDATRGAASMTSLADAAIFNAADAQDCWGHYLGPLLVDPPPYGSPSVARDLTGLPPAYVLAAGADCLRDEAIDYALRLLAAGVPTELHVVPDVPHGFTALRPGATVSRRLRAEVLAVLRRVVAGERVQTP